MSRKMPPEWRMYSIGGGAGARLVMWAGGGSAPPAGAPAPPAARDRLPDRRVRGIEAAVEADLERDARVLDRGQRPVDGLEVERDGLLAEDRLAGPGRL